MKSINHPQLGGNVVDPRKVIKMVNKPIKATPTQRAEALLRKGVTGSSKIKQTQWGEQ